MSGVLCRPIVPGRGAGGGRAGGVKGSRPSRIGVTTPLDFEDLPSRATS